MSSSWLKDYVLEGLGSEIRKASLNDGPDTTEATKERTVVDQARLVQILGRGQDGLESKTAAHRTRNLRSRSVSATAGNNDWWMPSRRGKSPNLAKHTNAWILVSDGSYSARLYLTTEALRDIFEWDNRNNNEDNLFKRGCSLMIKTYSFDCGKVEENNAHLAHFKVSSLEPKPGFNFHQGSKKNNDGRETTIRPVMEETDVLYGLQSLARLRQQRETRTNSSGSRMTRSSTKIARDWEIAFGRLSKGRPSTSTSTTPPKEKDQAIHVVDGKTALDDILKLAEAAASTEEAIREWEMAKKEFGILTQNSTSNDDETLNQNQQSKAMSPEAHTERQDSDEDDIGQSQEDLSHMYIQNILSASDEGEEESENDEENGRFETQPREETTGVEEDEESETMSVAMLQTQPADEEEKEPDKIHGSCTSRRRHKRPRSNSYESGTASNLTLDSNRKRKQQSRLKQQQENSQSSAGIWESVKEQLFEPGRTVVYCAPSSRVPGGSGNNDDENMLVTPNRPLASSCSSNNKNLGSGASVGTNLTSWTPNPSSGAYYRKYGLSRWLSRNTTSEGGRR